LGQIAYYSAEVMTFTDYYPFGSVMSERTWEAGSGYRYGFNGGEREADMVSSGDSYTFESRCLRTDLGRWLSLDYLHNKYPFTSPYSFALNSVISFSDYDGKDIWIVGKIDGQKTRVKYEIKTDPLTGNVVLPSPDENADQYIKDAFAALSDQINRGEGEHVVAIAQSSEVAITITNDKKYTEKNNGVYSAGKYKDKEGIIDTSGDDYENQGVIGWDNRMGVVAMYSDEKEGDIFFIDDPAVVFSPADVLDHEFGHGFSDLIEKKYYSRVITEAKEPKKFTNAEEENNVLSHDNNNGKIRNSDRIGIPFEANSYNDDSFKTTSDSVPQDIKVVKGKVTEHISKK
jgi:RHS repeat-associated protein